MIKIITHGNKYKTITHTCAHCRCKFEFTVDELNVLHGIVARNDNNSLETPAPWRYILCPECMREVYYLHTPDDEYINIERIEAGRYTFDVQDPKFDHRYRYYILHRKDERPLVYSYDKAISEWRGEEVTATKAKSYQMED